MHFQIWIIDDIQIKMRVSNIFDERLRTFFPIFLYEIFTVTTINTWNILW